MKKKNKKFKNIFLFYRFIHLWYTVGPEQMIQARNFWHSHALVLSVYDCCGIEHQFLFLDNLAMEIWGWPLLGIIFTTELRPLPKDCIMPSEIFLLGVNAFVPGMRKIVGIMLPQGWVYIIFLYIQGEIRCHCIEFILFLFMRNFTARWATRKNLKYF